MLWDPNRYDRASLGVKSLSYVDVFKVLMICPREELDFCPFKPVSPFLQNKFNCQQLVVPNAIVLFSRRKGLRKKAQDCIFGSAAER